LKTPVNSGIRGGEEGVQRPVDSQTGGRGPDQCISPLGATERGNGGGERGNGQRKREGERERNSMCVCDTEKEKSERSRTRTRRGGGGVKESRREKEYIAVIIAIDFYRQTITPGAPDGYPRRSSDAFFSFSFPSASLPSPFFTPSTVPISPMLVPDATLVAIESFRF